MEAVSEAPDETASNSSLVKSEGSPHPEGGRSSPPPNCAICLGRCRNKSFTDSCLHQFCFKCLLTWSRVKTECPLCKQNFKSIIHNVKSNQQYEEYPVEQPRSEDRGPTLEDISEMVNVARRFRYRTTLTLPRRDSLAIQQILMHYPLAAALVTDMPRAGAGGSRRSRRSATDFRRTVYRHNLWARPLPDFTGRFRDCTPEFFRYNDTQIHRLMPWLNRELYYLLNENSGHISYVMERILELLPQHPIISAEFRNAMHCYFGERTEHFLHEFFCFASTPYDITGYDRHVQYQTDSRVSAVVNEVLSSSDSDSRDSDIVMVSSSHPAPPAGASAVPSAGPSHAASPAPVYPRGYIPQPAVIPIETISHSDSDSSEVMVVGYIKPPHQRTPELVDLLGSDSDVVVQDTERAPAAEPPPAEPERAAPLVRLKLTRPRRPASAVDSESDSSYTPPPPPPRRKRRPRTDSARARTPPPVATPPPAAPFGDRTPPFSNEDSYEDTTDFSPNYEDSTDSSPSYDGRRSRPKRKPKRKSARATSSRAGVKVETTSSRAGVKVETTSSRAGVKVETTSSRAGVKVETASSRAGAKVEKRSPRRRKADKRIEERQQEREKRRKGKSRSAKDVKSSSVDVNGIPLPSEPSRSLEPSKSSEPSRSSESSRPSEPSQPAADQPGPSGVSSGRKRKGSAETAPRRSSRETKRLKSVVKVMPDFDPSQPMYNRNLDDMAISICEGFEPNHTCKYCYIDTNIPAPRYDGQVSSDDDLPLQLTINKKRSDGC